MRPFYISLANPTYNLPFPGILILVDGKPICTRAGSPFFLFLFFSFFFFLYISSFLLRAFIFFCLPYGCFMFLEIPDLGTLVALVGELEFEIKIGSIDVPPKPVYLRAVGLPIVITAPP